MIQSFLSSLCIATIQLITEKMRKQAQELTETPWVRAPPKSMSMESDTPVESRMKTVLTLTFSPNTSHG